MPSSRMVSAKDSNGRLGLRRGSGARRRWRTGGDRLVGLRRVVDLPRVLHLRHFTDIDVDELAVPLLDFADVYVLHDVALRVDLNWSAGAVKFLRLDKVDVFEG